MSLFTSSRRRRVLLAAVALAAGGYASYRLYKSSAVIRRRKQLIRFFSSMTFLGEAVSQSAESFSIISDDLRTFLLSDGDTVPRSLRQAFKIGQCPEFQETVTVLCCALTQGLLRGINGNTGKHGPGASNLESSKGLRLGKVDSGRQSDQSNSGVDGVCREIREVEFMKSRSALPAEVGCLNSEQKRETIPNGGVWPDIEEEYESREWEMKAQLPRGDLRELTDPSGHLWRSKRTRKLGVLLDRGKRGKREGRLSEGLPERLLAKLFSEPGVGFASAVVGSVARSCVTALLDGLQRQKEGVQGNKGVTKWDYHPQQKLTEESTVDDKTVNSQQTSIDMGVSDKKAPGNSQIVDLICDSQCRALIAECIQTFVSTAVTVYIDKTKDVNFYDDMVAGITNPSHQVPMKDMLTSVCNGAVETFVRTSHNLMFAKSSRQSDLNSDLNSSEQQQGWQVEKFRETGEDGPSFSGLQFSVQNSLPTISMEAQPQEIMIAGNNLEDFIPDPCSPSESKISSHRGAQVTLKPSDGRNGPLFQEVHNESVSRSLWRVGESNSSLQSWIDGLSKTLAIPSNRKLVVDVAGTMTSEAVRSFFDVVVSTVTNYFSANVRGGRQKLVGGVPKQKEEGKGHLQRSLGSSMSDAATKSFLLATICLAICLHVLVGVRMLESV